MRKQYGICIEDDVKKQVKEYSIKNNLSESRTVELCIIEKLLLIDNYKELRGRKTNPKNTIIQESNQMKTIKKTTSNLITETKKMLRKTLIYNSLGFDTPLFKYNQQCMKEYVQAQIDIATHYQCPKEVIDELEKARNICTSEIYENILNYLIQSDKEVKDMLFHYCKKYGRDPEKLWQYLKTGKMQNKISAKIEVIDSDGMED